MLSSRSVSEMIAVAAARKLFPPPATVGEGQTHEVHQRRARMRIVLLGSIRRCVPRPVARIVDCRSRTNNPQSVSSVSGIDTASRNNKRPAGVADAFQLRKHVVEFHRDDSRNVLAKHPSGSCFFNNAQHLRPEMTVIRRASSLPGDAEWLARKSTCDEVAAAVFLFRRSRRFEIIGTANPTASRAKFRCNCVFFLFSGRGSWGCGDGRGGGVGGGGVVGGDPGEYSGRVRRREAKTPPLRGGGKGEGGKKVEGGEGKGK